MAVRSSGPFEILAEKSRIALHARMSFAAFMPRRRWLNGHLVLARRPAPKAASGTAIDDRRWQHFRG